MALRLNFKIIVGLYAVFSIIIASIAFFMGSFPGDLGIKSIFIGPAIFLLPAKWLPNSIEYYLVASGVTLTLVWASTSSVRALYSKIYLLLSLILWVLIGFLGVIFIGFAAV
jgi:hypothetical protein